MTNQNSPQLAVDASRFPICHRCHKPVEKLSVQPHTQHANTVIVNYECHGARASQEMSSEILASERGLAGYTAFSDYTSGLMPG